MAKKFTIPTELGNDIKRNLQDAEIGAQEANGTSDVQYATFTSKTAERAENEAKTIKNEPVRRVESRSADRGPMMNVHVPYDVKEKLEKVKATRRRHGIKVTTDTIIYEAIIAWLGENYEREVE